MPTFVTITDAEGVESTAVYIDGLYVDTVTTVAEVAAAIGAEVVGSDWVPRVREEFGGFARKLSHVLRAVAAVTRGESDSDETVTDGPR